MNIRLTGNPARASKITPNPRLAPADATSGDFLTRTAPRVGDMEEDRTFRAVIATNTPVTRKDSKGPFLEVLDPAGLQFDAATDLPLLTDHRASARETVGRAFGIAVDGSAVTASLRLGMATDIEPLFERVRDGVLRHVSAGYQVLEWAESFDPDTRQRTKTATRWRLLEVSLTPIPADHRAIIQRRSATMPLDTETRPDFVEAIRSACGLTEEWAEGMAATDLDEDAIRAAAREELLKRQAPRIRVTRSHDDPAQVQTRAADALAFRMAGGELPAAAREFVGMSLLDHAREALARAGVSVRGMTQDEILQRSAMGTSDFPSLVSNAMNKVAAQAYQAAESPLKALARQRVLPNFKESTAIRLGEMGRLEEMTEHGEFKHTSRAEAGESMSLKTFGRAINVSRKLLIDDDLGLLGDMTAAMGQAAAQTEAEELVKLLTGNPKLSDAKAVFHATRGNLVTGSNTDLRDIDAAISALLAARQAMRTVKGLDGKTILAVKPKYLVVGPELEAGAERALTAIYAATSGDVNPMAGKLEIVVEPRITGLGWYVLADPASVPSLQYGYLASAQGVQIQRQEAWDTLGLKYRAWLDFGCGWLDWRGAYHGTGA
ncbi:HK97 family phage prohead protease [Rhodobacter viridis]|uniref:HK97 family phage prohead protease n=1 Tax=Rhodobacter viridis TaxID=1054202 RepID=A0A318UEB3_9RHOB|nr:HK97 family phage prohead protease [Rhodobacter viridis]